MATPPRERLEQGLHRLRVWRRWAVWWWREAELALALRFGLATREDRVFFALIPAVGVVMGFLGIFVHELILGVRLLLWEGPNLLAQVAAVPRWMVVAAPTLGGLAVGLLIWVSREPLSGGGGMASLIEAVALRGGRIAPRGTLLRAVAAVATVGSGGSLGREGPLIRMGAMLASWMALRLRLPPHRVKILVGCGAASGLAAVYNIPIGGALFAMEVILGNFALEIFGPLVVSSVIATLIARSFEGNEVTFPIPDYALVSGREVLAYLALGVLAAVASLVFTQGIRVVGGLFRSLRQVPLPLHPALGGLLIGLIALESPHVLGSGNETITLALSGQLALGSLLVLPFVKLLGSAISSGSGGSGGLYTPALFFGAMLGGAFGTVVHDAFPTWVGPSGAYAAVGMAALAAGTSHAPISAILMATELLDNQALIVPLMVACITSSLLARRLYKWSMYTEPLARKGIDLTWRMEEAALAGMEVGQLARHDPDTLRPEDPYRAVVGKFLAGRRQRLFVLGERGQLLGAVTFHDIRHMLEEPDSLTAVVAHDLMAPVEPVLHANERLHRAAHVFARSDFERLPVIDTESGRFVGVLGKRDVLGVYAQEVLGRPAMLATFVSSQESDAARDYVQLPPDFAVRLVPLPPALAGRSLAEARLPQVTGCRVIEIKRRDERGVITPIVPDGNTRFVAGDDVLLMGPTAALERIERGELDLAVAVGSGGEPTAAPTGVGGRGGRGDGAG
jgi:CIC family chloride channel protein